MPVPTSALGDGQPQQYILRPSQFRQLRRTATTRISAIHYANFYHRAQASSHTATAGGVLLYVRSRLDYYPLGIEALLLDRLCNYLGGRTSADTSNNVAVDDQMAGPLPAWCTKNFQRERS
jgi:hypothetical protein